MLICDICLQYFSNVPRRIQVKTICEFCKKEVECSDIQGIDLCATYGGAELGSEPDLNRIETLPYGGSAPNNPPALLPSIRGIFSDRPTNLHIFIGYYRNAQLVQLARTDEQSIIIPNLSFNSTFANENCLDRLRTIPGKVFISTDYSTVVDHSLPDEIFLCLKENECLQLLQSKEAKSFLTTWRAGTQSISEILISEGIWKE